MVGLLNGDTWLGTVETAPLYAVLGQHSNVFLRRGMVKYVTVGKSNGDITFATPSTRLAMAP